MYKRQKYSREDDEMNRSYSINRYEMPNIADVSSFQNAVIDPQTLMKEDELLKMCIRDRGKERMLAFGPYLSAGIWFSMMWGQELIQWYINQF